MSFSTYYISAAYFKINVNNPPFFHLLSFRYSIVVITILKQLLFDVDQNETVIFL